MFTLDGASAIRCSIPHCLRFGFIFICFNAIFTILTNKQVNNQTRSKNKWKKQKKLSIFSLCRNSVAIVFTGFFSSFCQSNVGYFVFLFVILYFCLGINLTKVIMSNESDKLPTTDFNSIR